MTEGWEALSERRVWSALTGRDTGPFGKNVRYIEQVGSTNDIARQMAEEHAPEGTLVITDEQVAGRGRMGREWVAPSRSSLLMSMLFRPKLAADQAFRLVMACGLAIADACERLADVRVEVKWPNDLLINGRKLAGILPESAIVGERLAWVIVGMGINVNQTFADNDPLAETATSLYMATGNHIDRVGLLGEIIEQLHEWHSQLSEDVLSDAWRERCTTLSQRVQATVNGERITGWAERIDDAGALWVQPDNGPAIRLTAGEATLLK